MKKIFKILIGVIIVFAVAVSAMFFYLKSRPIPVIQIGSIDLNSIQDGSYTGNYSSPAAKPDEPALVEAAVKVDVAGNKITGIKIIEHKNGLGKKAEKITDEIIRKQSLDVDTVSGATLSSKVILKAVETAIEKGKKQ